MIDTIDPRGLVRVEHWRGEKLLRICEFRNGITNLGKNLMLGRMFNGVAQSSSWAFGLIDNVSFSGLSANDIMSSHSGWIEWLTISSSTRQTWGQGAASGQQVTNASVVTATMTAAGILQGVFIVDDTTKGGNSGNLWATALFSTSLIVAIGDNLRLSYAVQL